MDQLEFLQAVESRLERDIVVDSDLEKLVYELYDEGENVQYVCELVWDQRDDTDVCAVREPVGLKTHRDPSLETTGPESRRRAYLERE